MIEWGTIVSLPPALTVHSPQNVGMCASKVCHYHSIHSATPVPHRHSAQIPLLFQIPEPAKCSGALCGAHSPKLPPAGLYKAIERTNSCVNSTHSVNGLPTFKMSSCTNRM